MHRLEGALLPTTVAASLALLLLAAPATSALPREKERWVELDTPHFTFFSNASQRHTLRIAADLERLRAVLDELSALELGSPVPTVIYVFKSEASFRRYTLLRDGRPEELSGYFGAREHANYVAINGGSGWDESDVVYRAYVHQVFDHNFADLPLWLDRGLSELYSTFKVAGDTAHIGLPVPEYVLWLRDNPLMPLDQLLVADRDSVRSRGRRRVFDAQAWALVHYLLVGNEERRAQCVRYLELLVEAPADQAFRQAFGTDPATLEKELRSYLRGRVFRYWRMGVEIRPLVLSRLRPMAYPDVLYRLGDLLASHEPVREAEAGEHFRAALAATPDHTQALAGLGFLEEQRERRQEAADSYARAAELAPDDPLIQYRHGAALLQRGGDAAPAVAALRRSVEHDPDFAPAWARLTYAHALGAESPTEAALRAGETAHRLLPSRIDVAFNLLALYARAGRREAAQRVLDGYLALRAEPADIVRARGHLAAMDLERAGELLAAGRLDEAEEILDRLQALVAGGNLASDFEELLLGFRVAVEDRRFDARFSQVTARLNAGEPEVAVNMLEELIAEGLEARHGERARSLLDQVRGQRERESARQARERHRADSDAAQRADRERVSGLLARNRPAEAVEVLERMSRRPSSTAMRRWIDGTMAQTRDVIEHNRFLERYNEAVDWFNAQEYAAAAKVLAQLIATMPEDRAVDAARELLAEAKAEMKRQS